MIIREIELPEDQADRLEALARQLDTSSEMLIEIAIEAMLDNTKWALSIEALLREVEAAEELSDEQVKALFKMYMLPK